MAVGQNGAISLIVPEPVQKVLKPELEPVLSLPHCMEVMIVSERTQTLIPVS